MEQSSLKLFVVTVLLLLILTACGRTQNKFSGLVPPVPTVTPSVTPIPPFPTPTPTPTATPPPTACTQPFQLEGNLLNGPGSVFVGQPVTIRLQASACPGIIFQLQSRGNTVPFTTYYDWNLYYSAPGSVAEVFVVAALSAANPSQLIDLKQVVVPFTVQTPEPAGSCLITRVANTTVRNLNDPMLVRIQTSIPVERLTLNGSSANAGVALQLPPRYRDSGEYVAEVEAVTATQTFRCTATFETPVCEHRVVNAELGFLSPWVMVQSETTLRGPVSMATVNGFFVFPLPVPPANKVQAFSSLSIFQEQVISRARVRSPLGDEAECSELVRW